MPFLAIMGQFNSKVFLGLSFSSLALLYSVMLLGVYITASNQGLSCPDWPLCPNGFGFPPEKYFFEHTHREMVIITASVIVATAVYAVRKVRIPGVTRTAVAAAAIIAIQITMGFLVIYTGLAPLVVATHLSTGILLFAMTLMTFLSSYRLAKNNKIRSPSQT